MKMLPLLSCVVLYLSQVESQNYPIPYGPASNAASFPRVPSTTYPYRVPGVSGLPGSRNTYYNYHPLGEPHVPILTYSNEAVQPDGTYSFSFSTGDGKQVQENGFVKDAYVNGDGEPQGTQVIQGSYSYISPEGLPIQVTYVADENGFRPSGVHIPSVVSNVNTNYYNVGNYTQRGYDSYYNRYNPSRYQDQATNYRFHLNNHQNDAYYQTPAYNRYYYNNYNHVYNGHRRTYDTRYNSLGPVHLPFYSHVNHKHVKVGPNKNSD